MIQFEEIEQALIDTIRGLVGDKLSTLPKTTLPAVFRQRSSAPLPQEPYITFEALTNLDFGGWLRDRVVLDQEAFQVDHIAEKTIIYRIYCYGDERTMRILEELTSKLNVASFRQTLNQSGARILKINPPTLTPRLFADEYKSNSFLDIFINATSVVSETDEGNGFIESVEVNDKLIDCN